MLPTSSALCYWHVLSCMIDSDEATQKVNFLFGTCVIRNATHAQLHSVWLYYPNFHMLTAMLHKCLQFVVSPPNLTLNEEECGYND